MSKTFSKENVKSLAKAFDAWVGDMDDCMVKDYAPMPYNFIMSIIDNPSEYGLMLYKAALNLLDDVGVISDIFHNTLRHYKRKYDLDLRLPSNRIWYAAAYDALIVQIDKYTTTDITQIRDLCQTKYACENGLVVYKFVGDNNVDAFYITQPSNSDF